MHNGGIDRSQKPHPLVIVTTPVKQTVKHDQLDRLPWRQEVYLCVSELFWSNILEISSRSKHKGLQYAVEGYSKYKNSNEGDTTGLKRNLRNPMTCTSNATSTPMKIL